MTLQKKAYISIVLLIIAYAWLTLAIPVDQAALRRYNVSSAKASIINISVLIPYAFIWFAGVYGFVKLKIYSQLIKKNKDGLAFSHIATGLGVLAFRLPLSAVLSSLANYYTRTHLGARPATTIVLNYINLLMAVVAFTLIGKGIAVLLDLTPKKPASSMKLTNLIGVSALIISYTYVTLNDPNYQHAASRDGRATFYLPAWLIVITIVLPYAYVWYRGFLTAYAIHYYRRNVPGILYKQALYQLAAGVGAVIGASIVLQFTTSQASRLNRLNLAPLLFLVYLLLFVISIGFVLIALGAKKLQRIEEA